MWDEQMYIVTASEYRASRTKQVLAAFTELRHATYFAMLQTERWYLEDRGEHAGIWLPYTEEISERTAVPLYRSLVYGAHRVPWNPLAEKLTARRGSQEGSTYNDYPLLQWPSSSVVCDG